MTANEAYQKSMDKNNKDCKAQMDSILMYINRTCDKGEFKLHWYDPILPCVEINLKVLGYSIKTCPDPKDGDYYEISW